MESETADLVVLEEWNGIASSKLTKTATITIPHKKPTSSSSSSSAPSIQKSSSQFSHISGRILQAFVPEASIHLPSRWVSVINFNFASGFPNSVTPDYVPFQVWDLLQGLSTYIRTMLSTQALLSAIGVGEKSATVIGATFQWFLRDLTGMLGGILFTCYQGSNLDSNAKMWRLVADFMNDLGMLMDLLSPLFPSAFIFVVCLGSLSRSFTGVASGATRAALTQHFALQNNAADISAKEGSQETVATMIGMAFGMILAHITMGHSLSIWICFLSLTLFHMYANYRAVSCLSLITLNCQRSSTVFLEFFKNGQVLSPKEVSSLERILPLWLTPWSSKVNCLHSRVRMDVRISSLNNDDLGELSRLATSHYKKAKYLLLNKRGVISIVMHKGSTAADVLKAFIHSLVMAKLVDGGSSAHSESQQWINTNYDIFLLKLQTSGWRTERLLSPSVTWKANWTLASSNRKVE
ncbi:OLC1v1032621C1 [Oldenlandia corymbosa var. corymbosa]|uniref:OLC1v1032621C1 n=1 Tax=Oldenlandia corymbosa var. corymbosa TaxID=529605 RepID=A0AAV1CLF9_OLDCO|nr:OLC1v1032621C1 [Oldenlandia corymbosa var. corymbosa]